MMATRTEVISKGLKAGLTTTEIAVTLGLTQQRVSQLIGATPPLRRLLQARKELSAANTARKKAEHRAKLIARLGYSEDDDDAHIIKMKRVAQIIQSLRMNAYHRGIHFNLKPGHLIWPDVCPVLGTPLNYWNTRGQPDSPSVDRLDPTKGYVRSNCCVISNRANRIKNDANSDELYKVYLYAHAHGV